jgi:multidrug resistance protein
VVIATHVVTSGLSPRRMRAIILLLAGCVALMMTGSGIIMPIFARRLGELGAGVRMLGILSMSFALAQFVSSPFMGSFADRFGRRPLVLMALAAFACANVGYMLAPSPAALIAIRALGGAFTAGLSPAALGIIGDIAPKEQQARWIGVVMGSYSVGLVFGPVLGGVLYDAWGYAAPFLVSATMATIALMSAVIVVPETRTREVRRREKLRQRRADDATRAAGAGSEAGARTGPKTGTEPGSGTEAVESRWTAFLSELPRPLYVFGMLLFLDFVAAFAFGFIDAQMAFYLYNDLMWTTIQFGVMVGAYGLTVVLGQVALGQWSDRWGRKPVILLGLSLTALFFFTLATVRAFPVLLLAAIVAGLGDALSAPARSAFYFDITPSPNRARVLGIKGSSVSLGGIVGPLLLVAVSGLLTPQLIFGLAGVVLVVAVLVALFTLKEPRHVAVDPDDAGWQVSSRRALAAQNALRGITLQALVSRGIRRGDIV